MDKTQDKATPKYWMSLEQWRQDPEFRAMAEREFVSSPLQSEDGKDGWARREFLKLMGASLAMTSFGCVRRPAQKIIPYVNKPADVVHGIPNYYASSYVDGLEGLGILVTTRDGRPIKIEGNPDHPAAAGGMSARAHADILRLYDPDRHTGPKRNLQNEKRTNREVVGLKWETLDKEVATQLKKGKGALLMSTCLSPTTQALVDDFASAFNVKVYRYDDVSYDSLRAAQKASYGQDALPNYHFERARYVLAVNNDFMGTWLTPTRFQYQFMKGRKKTSEMNKLVVAESLMSLTGTNADQRYRIRPSQSLDLLMAILHELLVTRKVSKYAGDANVARVLAGFSKSASDLGLPVSEIAEELWKNRGQSLVVAGGLSAQTDNAVALQIAANFLNAVLENDGKTVDGIGSAVTQGRTVVGGIGELLSALKAGEVKTLIIHGSNPVYTLPTEAQFAESLSKVEMIIATADRNHETARLADYVATDHHPLENWGDMMSVDGTLSIQQPTIQPLHNTRAFQDSLLAWMKVVQVGSPRARGSETWYDYLRTNWKENFARGASNFESRWTSVLESGVSADSGKTAGTKPFQTAALSNVKPSSRVAGMELALYETIGLGDGTLANVPWLQELPDPVTKICWDNYACFSMKDAARLSLKEGSHVMLTVGGEKLTVPAHIQAGQADGVVGLAVGYGRQGVGQVADGIGVNAFRLSQWKNGMRITAGLEADVKLEKGLTPLACTQEHHTMEGRQLVVEETLRDFVKNPGGSVHRHELTTMWSEHKYPGHKWGMTIDLSTCTGCSACVIACQSENNIPTVGKKNVIDGREMHWIRIDRYYAGEAEDPAVVFQPIVCMHCDNAPCETVCPVIATMHSDEGTNDMIYNRCVGTRYCANNCPYKVRRFNWFNFNNDIPAPRQMALNPEVTTRFRGVMEKCTFCIHRINFHKAQAKLQDRKLGANEVQTACAQACPTKAITFGDLNNKESAVAKQFSAPSTYALLDELNVKPAVRYHVKVRNTEAIKGQKHHGEGHHA